MDCKIKLLEFRHDENNPHITVTDPEYCRKCDAGVCLTICPSGVFKWNYQNEAAPVLIYYKQCIECGACRLACPYNNIQFQFPSGGYGVTFRDGISVYPRPNQAPKLT
jgi:ferredoxin like protein